jgi:hypothetical protein
LFDHLASDRKASRFLSFYQKLKKLKLSKEEELKRMLTFAHAAYITRGGKIHEWIAEDSDDSDDDTEDDLHEDSHGDSQEARGEGGGAASATPLRNVWLHGTIEEMRQLVANLAAASTASQEAGTGAFAILRHAITGCPFTTKPPNEDGVGGDGASMAGYADLSRADRSLLQAIWLQGDRLHTANGDGGAAKVLKTLKEKAFPGGGQLTSSRVLTYSEGTGLFDAVLEAYLAGGGGTSAAKVFIGVMLEFSEEESKAIKELDVMAELKDQLETTTADGLMPLEERLHAIAKGCPAFAGMEDAIAFLGSFEYTGGMLETTGCDVIWRLYRPLILGSEKPRPKVWDADASGGNSLHLYPGWRSGKCTIYKLRKYLTAAFHARASATKPSADDVKFKCT